MKNSDEFQFNSPEKLKVPQSVPLVLEKIEHMSDMEEDEEPNPLSHEKQLNQEMAQPLKQHEKEEFYDKIADQESSATHI